MKMIATEKRRTALIEVILKVKKRRTMKMKVMKEKLKMLKDTNIIIIIITMKIYRKMKIMMIKVKRMTPMKMKMTKTRIKMTIKTHRVTKRTKQKQ